MILTTRAPLRISFFGGGTDYPEYFKGRKGAVLGMAIDKYVYVSATKLTSATDYKYKVSYSKIEKTNHIEEIEHPVVRETLKYYRITEPLDISITSDLPARSGLGSSSSFTVALVKLITTLTSQEITNHDLANIAIYIERELLKENVGVQDQYHSAFGGINKFEFYDKRTIIHPVSIGTQSLNQFLSSLFLVYTGKTRYASETLDEQIAKTKRGLVDQELLHLLTMTDQALEILESNNAEIITSQFGQLLHEGWELKKKFSSKVSSQDIDELYNRGIRSGATGGKLCGAGSGGFILFLVPKINQKSFSEIMKNETIIPINLDKAGAAVINKYQ